MLFTAVANAVLLRAKSALKDKRPNIVWVLADDLHFESGLIENMPHLRQMAADGLEFPNHVSTAPLCGPSRASLISGRFPHNSGYKTNAAEDSVSAFLKIQDKSVGKWLTDAGYYTAFLGKYVNGLIGSVDLSPKGWNHYGGFTGEWDAYKQQWLGGTYTYYNASQWNLDFDDKGENLKNLPDYPILIHENVHQADFLGEQTLSHAQEGIKRGKPFFILTNPAMVHHGYCEGPFEDDSMYKQDDPWREQFFIGTPISPCAKKDRPSNFLNTKFGTWRMHARGAAWNQTAFGQAKSPITCCNSTDVERFSYGIANRTSSMTDLDDMLGFIVAGLEEMKVLDNTYVIFTSDNGFHLGEHKYQYGKLLPYDHDVRVPMVIRTPSSASKGDVRVLPTSHVDITRTLVDLAGAEEYAPLNELDGKSFIDAFKGDVSLEDWRRWSFSEMFEKNGKTWRNIRWIGNNGKAKWNIALWCSGEVEVYRIDGDEGQMYNTVAEGASSEAKAFGKDVMDKWLPVLNGMGDCAGPACNKKDTIQKQLDGTSLSDLMACEDHQRGGANR
jgi:arylsulfatase A-like enzyme